MSETRVWQNDRHEISWGVTSGGAPVDLTGATVRLVARPGKAPQTPVDLPCSVANGVVTHTLTGDLPVDYYDVVVEATRAGQTVTYPDAATGPERLVVRADVG